MRGHCARLCLLLLVPACKPRSEAAPESAADTAAARPADSLVATAPAGEEIWFTLSRESEAADGSRCTDRTIEIRRGGTRVPVPLLYTGAPPEVVNDTTIRARLYNQCVPRDAYLVDLRTGRPVRER